MVLYRSFLFMPRYYRRRYRNKKNKWEQLQVISYLYLHQNKETAAVVVPADLANGVRCVKHLKITLTTPYIGLADQGNINVGNSLTFFWALVYVPQGYDPQEIQVPSQIDSSIPMYDANQYVMASGVATITTEPVVVRTPLSRNLNSGDSIQLICASLAAGASSEDVPIWGHTSYSICYK